MPDDPLQTKLNQERWQEYTRQTAELDELYTARTMKMVLMAVVANPTKEWRDKMEFMGIALPPVNSPAEKYTFVETEVIQSPTDLAKLMTSVFRLAGIINEEGVTQAEATFQGVVERAFTQAGKQSPAKQPLDGDKLLQRDSDGPLLEQKTVRTRPV